MFYSFLHSYYYKEFIINWIQTAFIQPKIILHTQREATPNQERACEAKQAHKAAEDLEVGLHGYKKLTNMPFATSLNVNRLWEQVWWLETRCVIMLLASEMRWELWTGPVHYFLVLQRVSDNAAELWRKQLCALFHRVKSQPCRVWSTAGEDAVIIPLEKSIMQQQRWRLINQEGHVTAEKTLSM